MKSATLIHEVSPDQLTAFFQGLQSQIDDLKKGLQPKTPAEYLTRAEVAQLLKCDLSTVHNWTKRQKLKAYGISGRVYYKRAEVEACLIPINQ